MSLCENSAVRVPRAHIHIYCTKTLYLCMHDVIFILKWTALNVRDHFAKAIN
jgi:hypothetical protein